MLIIIIIQKDNNNNKKKKKKFNNISLAGRIHTYSTQSPVLLV